jgi:hypothetical protein
MKPIEELVHDWYDSFIVKEPRFWHINVLTPPMIYLKHSFAPLIDHDYSREQPFCKNMG